jgi:hypothetical protein
MDIAQSKTTEFSFLHTHNPSSSRQELREKSQKCSIDGFIPDGRPVIRHEKNLEGRCAPRGFNKKKTKALSPVVLNQPLNPLNHHLTLQLEIKEIT